MRAPSDFAARNVPHGDRNRSRASTQVRASMHTCSPGRAFVSDGKLAPRSPRRAVPAAGLDANVLAQV